VEIHQIFVGFQKAYDSTRRDKLYVIMAHLGIPDKLIRLTKATMENNLPCKDRDSYDGWLQGKNWTKTRKWTGAQPL